MFLGAELAVYGQSPLELEADKFLASVDVKSAEACLFGRLSKNDQVRWVHIELSRDPLNTFLHIIKRPGIIVKHEEGPFGAETALKVRVADRKGMVVFILRIWNGTISIERSGEETISFECLDFKLPDELRAFVSQMAGKKSPDAKIREAATFEELLEQLALGDPQIK